MIRVFFEHRVQDANNPYRGLDVKTFKTPFEAYDFLLWKKDTISVRYVFEDGLVNFVINTEPANTDDL